MRSPFTPAPASKSRWLGTLATSPASGPVIACSTSIVSSTLRAIGPSLSSDQHSVIAPVRGTRPYVGRSPFTPQRKLGLTMLPSVSLPIENPTRPAAVAAPGPALEPDVVERERAHAQLCHQHRACLIQPRHHRRVRSRDAVSKRLRAVGRGDAGRIEQVLHAKRNAVQRSAIMPCGDFGVGLFGLRKRQVAREGDYTAELRIVLLQAREIDVR